MLCFDQQFGRYLWSGVGQDGITPFIVDILLERNGGRPGIQLEGIPAFRSSGRIITEERPLGGLHGRFLLFQAVEHVVSMGDAVAIRDD